MKFKKFLSPPVFPDDERTRAANLINEILWSMLAILMGLFAFTVYIYRGEQSRPRIDIGAAAKANEITFFVRDNGMGIHPKYHDKVFGLFDRLDNGDIEGTGVGLALVKRIVEVHGGSVWLKSAGKNQGSTFYFTLPVGKINN